MCYNIITGATGSQEAQNETNTSGGDEHVQIDKYNYDNKSSQIVIQMSHKLNSNMLVPNEKHVSLKI